MLTIKEQMKLNSLNKLKTINESLNQRISMNYNVIGNNITSEDLLHIVTSPPELFYAEGNMTNLVFDNKFNENNNLKVDVINNLINRVMLINNDNFTYQDSVYISAILEKLGIKNIQEFINNVSQLRQENNNINKLIDMYWNNGEIVKQLALEIKNEVKKDNNELQPENQEQGKYYLHQDIYRRLNTAVVYNDLGEFVKVYPSISNILTKNELSISEQMRVSNDILLSELKQEYTLENKGILEHHINKYEIGINSNSNINKETITNDVVSAVMLNLIDNIYYAKKDYINENVDFWFETNNSLFESGENTLKRFEIYHTDNILMETDKLTYTEDLNKIYNYEISLLTDLKNNYDNILFNINNNHSFIEQDLINSYNNENNLNEYNDNEINNENSSYTNNQIQKDYSNLTEYQNNYDKILHNLNSKNTFIEQELINSNNNKENLNEYNKNEINNQENSYTNKQIQNNLKTVENREDINVEQLTKHNSNVYNKEDLLQYLTNTLSEETQIIDEVGRINTINNSFNNMEANEVISYIENNITNTFINSNMIKVYKDIINEIKSENIENITNEKQLMLRDIATEIYLKLPQEKKPEIKNEIIENLKNTVYEILETSNFAEDIKETKILREHNIYEYKDYKNISSSLLEEVRKNINIVNPSYEYTNQTDFKNISIQNVYTDTLEAVSENQYENIENNMEYNKKQLDIFNQKNIELNNILNNTIEENNQEIKNIILDKKKVQRTALEALDNQEEVLKIIENSNETIVNNQEIVSEKVKELASKETIEIFQKVFNYGKDKTAYLDSDSTKEFIENSSNKETINNLSEEYTNNTNETNVIQDEINKYTEIDLSINKNMEKNNYFVHKLSEIEIYNEMNKLESINKYEIQEGSASSSVNKIVNEVTENVIEKWSLSPTAKVVSAKEQEKEIQFIHKIVENEINEEILQQIKENRQTTALKDVETSEQTVTNRTNTREIENVSSNIISKTSDEITQLIEKGLQRQIGAISERVYRSIEKKLVSDRKRRGF